MHALLSSIAAASLLAAASLAPALARADDLAAKIKSRNVEDRLIAIESIQRDGAKDAEKLLVDALDDKDWEVVERAAAALGERGGAASIDKLSAIALGGPVRRIRVAAARSLAKLDPKAAAEHLEKAAKGATLQRACEGLAQIAPIVGERARKGLEAGLKSSDATIRATAAAGLAAFPVAERGALITKCVQDSELTVGAAALDAAHATPDPALAPVLLETLGRGDLHEVLERRAVRAILSLFAAAPKEGRAELGGKVVAAMKAAPPDATRARFARLVGQLAAKPPESPDGAAAAAGSAEPLMDATVAVAALEPACAGGDEGTRAAAVHALGRIATPAALDRVAAVATSDRAARVRSVALRDVVAARGVKHAGTLDLARKCLADADIDVREDAVVALGRPGVIGAVAALLPLLKDGDWGVAVAAAVSLGKTQDPAALPALTELAKEKDWRLRAAALVGLGHLKHKSAVPLLIDALGAKEATAKQTALEFLKRMTSDKVAAKESAWKSWWTKNEASYQFTDPSVTARKLQKYGYAPTPYGVYEDLDVLVFRSRGDHIETMLEKIDVAHRTTQGGNVAEAGVEPYGVYVANCPAEGSPEDLEHVRWFVHAGGYLFCSCWSLTTQAAQVRPGFAQQFHARGEVMDLVTAEPCRDSPYLDGVFDGVTRPKYVLEGSHLIEVLDPERVEVLIDSPECATRWGCGNLAAWWTVGHGLILDSANHFDLQGFSRAPQMKEAVERMAYAIDTLGLSYADWRAVPKAAWTSQTKAIDEVRDLSAFRFITNFVRFKRQSGS